MTTQPDVRLAHVSTREAMHTPIVDCPPNASLGEVAALMAGHSIHCVIVDGVRIDGNGEHVVWAVVSDSDLVRGALTGDTELTAAAIASTEPLTVDAGDNLEAASALLAEHEASHVVVVESGRPVGVVSTLDVARSLAT